MKNRFVGCLATFIVGILGILGVIVLPSPAMAAEPTSPIPMQKIDFHNAVIGDYYVLKNLSVERADDVRLIQPTDGGKLVKARSQVYYDPGSSGRSPAGRTVTSGAIELTYKNAIYKRMSNNRAEPAADLKITIKNFRFQEVPSCYFSDREYCPKPWVIVSDWYDARYKNNLDDIYKYEKYTSLSSTHALSDYTFEFMKNGRPKALSNVAWSLYDIDQIHPDPDYREQVNILPPYASKVFIGTNNDLKISKNNTRFEATQPSEDLNRTSVSVLYNRTSAIRLRMGGLGHTSIYSNQSFNKSLIEITKPRMNTEAEIKCNEWTTVTVPADTSEVTYKKTENSYNHTVTVTATARPGYIINGQDTWTFNLLQKDCSVTPAEPKLVKAEKCGERDTVMVPEDTDKISYTKTEDKRRFIVRVKATAKPGYTISGKDTWTFKLKKKNCFVTPAEPKLVKAEECGEQDTVIVPEDTDKISYTKTEDKYSHMVTVVANAKPGYTINGQNSWQFKLETKECTVKPTPPQFVKAEKCGEQDTVIVPKDTDAISYTKTEDTANNSVEVTATAKPGHFIQGQASWWFRLSTATCSISTNKTSVFHQASDTMGTIDYTIGITNTGNTPVTDLSIDESGFTGQGKSLDQVQCPKTSLAPGEKMNCTIQYAIVQEDIDKGSPITNTAVITGKAFDKSPLRSSSTVTDRIMMPKPEISVEKKADKTENVKAGEQITYTITVKNTGNVTLKNFNTVDDKFSGSGKLENLTCKTPDSLAPHQSYSCTATYTVTQEDIDTQTPLTNVACAYATMPDNQPIRGCGDAIVKVNPSQPQLTLDKKASKTKNVVAGDTIDYTITVSNTGNVVLSNIKITDDNFNGTGKLAELKGEIPDKLGVGQSFTLTTSYVVQQEDIDKGTDLINIANGTATDPKGGEVTDDGTAESTPDEQKPAIHVVKDADKTDNVKAGDLITYTATMTNTGNVTLKDMSIAETVFTGKGEPVKLVCPEMQQLNVGGSMSCVGTYEVVQGDIDQAQAISNTVEGSAHSPKDVVVKETADKTVNLVAPQPAYTLDKVVDEGDEPVDVGDTIHYSFTATNTGNVTIKNLVLNDPKLGINAHSLGDLAPGETAVLEHQSYTVTEQDVLDGEVFNEASITGIEPKGKTPIPETKDNVKTPTKDPNPAYTIEKTALTPEGKDITSPLKIGDKIIYRITVTNTGDLTINNLIVKDDKLGIEQKAENALAPGQSYTVKDLEYVVTEADVAKGSADNTATTHGDFPQGTPEKSIPKDPTSTVQTPTAPADTTIGVEKTGVLADDRDGNWRINEGDGIAYSFTVTNRGNITVKDATIVDEKLGYTGKLNRKLAPGESATVTVETHYVVTKSDAWLGRVHNTVTVTPEYPYDNLTPDPVTAKHTLMVDMPLMGLLPLTGGKGVVVLTVVVLLIAGAGFGLRAMSRKKDE